MLMPLLLLLLLLLLLQGLPSSLTRLKLEWHGNEVISSTTAPSLAQLTALQRFELQGEHSNVCPSILLHMQQLRHLTICEIASNGLQTLLDALQSMQQLQFLHVYSASWAAVEPAFEQMALQGEAMQQYAHLTASTQLTHLDMTYDENILADGAAQYMFAEGKQLPHLKALHFGLEDYDGSELPLPIGEGDLARIAAACPALEQLWAAPGIQPSADLAELALLTSVTQLRVAGWDLNARKLSAALVRMTQLVDLQLEDVDEFGTLELATLTQLTVLQVLCVHMADDNMLLADDSHPNQVSLHSRVRGHRN
jgi:hypothetical protein